MLRMRLTVWRDNEATPILNMPGFVSNGGMHWDAGHDPIIDDDGREIHAICATADVRDPAVLPPTCQPTRTECPLCKNDFRNMPPHCRMRGGKGMPYPTIESLADLSASTVGYQGPVLVEEAVRCWRELERITATHKALMANADARYDELHAEVLELQRELAAKNKPVVCYSNCAMHKHVPWTMKVTVMTGTVATVCPICHPPEQGA